MNATRQATTYAQPATVVLGGARRNIITTQHSRSVVRHSAVARSGAPPSPARVSDGEVRALLDAAGPLTVRDIAGGLNVPERAASAVVWRMMDDDCVKQDEWGRVQLWGSCREA